MKKSLVIGATGLVGSALMRQLGPSAVGTVCTADTESGKYLQMNMTNLDEVNLVISSVDPEVIYIPAGITNVDRCEEQRKLTSLTNVQGILNVINTGRGKIVFFSSSYVFDGEKDLPYQVGEATCPINQYGEQKLEIENRLKTYANSVIIRTIGVFGKEHKNKNFAAQIVRAMTLGNEIHVPMDQIMNPVSSDDLAKVSVRLGEECTGTFHVGGDKCVSKYQFAKDIASRSGLVVDESLIVATESKNMRQSADRPKNGCLDSYGLEEIGLSVPSYYEGLTKYFKQ